MTESRPLLGVVMDPIETIKPKKDSTLAMLLAAQRAGWAIAYFRQQDLMVRDGVALGAAGGSRYATTRNSGSSSAPPWSNGLEHLDVLLMRKDPPFDMEYIYTTYILELAEQRGLLVVNKPASLRDINEKAFTSLVPAVHAAEPRHPRRGPSCFRSSTSTREIVLKPLDGMGGPRSSSSRAGDLNANVIIETLTDNGERFTLAQRYIPEIAHGRQARPAHRWRADRLRARADPARPARAAATS